MGWQQLAKYKTLQERLQRNLRVEYLKRQKDRIRARKISREEVKRAIKALLWKIRPFKRVNLYCICGRQKYKDLNYTPGCPKCQAAKKQTRISRKSKARWEDRGSFYWLDGEPGQPLFDQEVASMIRMVR